MVRSPTAHNWCPTIEFFFMRESQASDLNDRAAGDPPSIVNEGDAGSDGDFVINDFSSGGTPANTLVTRLSMPRISTRYALALILLLALALRLYGINWDSVYGVSLIGAIAMVWLVFFPPKLYQRWLSNSELMAKTVEN